MLDELLTEQNSYYLIKSRLENLQQQIDKSVDELLEEQELKAILRLFDGKESHDPTPSLSLRKLALLEATRVNRPDIADSRFDDLYDLDELSNINASYIALIRKSRCNPKSLKLITNQGKEIGKDVFPSLTVYHLFPPNAPKISLVDWIAKEQRKNGTHKFSSSELWQLKLAWETYSKTRVLNTSPCQKVVHRIIDVATSPIYEGMEKTGKRAYRLQQGITLRETDKTFIFTIPFQEFSDIPATPHYVLKYIASIEAAFILPNYAQEKTRYFSKKGATLDNFLLYLKGLDINVEYPLHRQLETSSHIMRFYRECFSGQISGYFISARSDQRHILADLRTTVLRSGSQAIVRHVTHLSMQYPDWMRKIGGLIIDPKDGESVFLSNSSRKADAHVLDENLFTPSQDLRDAQSHLSTAEMQDRYTEEMRAVYRKHHQEFIDTAIRYCENKFQIGQNGTEPQYVEMLDRILKHVYAKVKRQ